jgi:caa(3)-type oxidase subunit IV
VKTGGKHDPNLVFVVAWLVMVLLIGISIWTAFLGLGHFAPVIEFGIAATQAAILFILFMRLKGPPSLKWVFAGTGFFWLLFLYGIATIDYASRRGWPSMH